MGIPSDARFLAVGRQAPRAPVPAAAAAARLLQAPPAAGRHDRVADRRVRQPEPGLRRRSAAGRLDPGRVRPQPSRRSRRALADAADYGYCAQPLPLLLGLPAARPVRARRHPARARAHLPEARRTRGLPATARPLPAPRRRSCSATRATPAATSPPRSRPPTPRSSAHAARTNPATARISPRSANASNRSSGPAKTCSRLERHGARTLHGLRERIRQRASSPRRRDRAQPPTRPPQPRTRQLQRLTAWNNSSSTAPLGQGGARSGEVGGSRRRQVGQWPVQQAMRVWSSRSSANRLRLPP